MATGRPDAAAEQLDLFSGAGGAPLEPETGPAGWAPLDPSRLSDGDLIAAIPLARQVDAAPLAREAVRRGLRDAIPALERLCRRFSGFGLDRAVIEQTASLRGLAALGGRAAAELVVQLIVSRAVQGPGVRVALEAAADLRCRLPPDRIAAFLRDDDPAVRTAACRCARTGAEVISALIDLLVGLHDDVSDSAALALGRMGRREAKPLLTRMLLTVPTAEVIGALAAIAEDDDWVRLGQTAMRVPELSSTVLEALEESDVQRALAVAEGVRRRLAITRR